MKREATFSRRSAIFSFGGLPLVKAALPSTAASAADTHLFALGREFDAVAARVDQAIAGRADVNWSALDELARLETEIVAAQACTKEGLCVKARAACWALLGDLDPAAQTTTDKRMALSIVRDLIRLYDPQLERPEALKKLVSEIESDASNS